ncbi:hypothetical protein [Nocardia sp. NPDC004604]|uniref:hypothetical protein n=1 Tax=Nocardia sp. NPDC004604 TaxID=3157013 RepID=UPI0033B4DF2B
MLAWARVELPDHVELLVDPDALELLPHLLGRSARMGSGARTAAEEAVAARLRGR